MENLRLSADSTLFQSFHHFQFLNIWKNLFYTNVILIELWVRSIIEALKGISYEVIVSSFSTAVSNAIKYDESQACFL